MVLRALLMLGCLASLLSFIGCALFETDLPGYEARPASDYQILERGESPSLIFGEDVDRISVEDLARLSSGSGSVETRMIWEDRRLTLEPEESPVPGRKYRLLFDGIYRNSRGKDRRSSLSRPFCWEYAGERHLNLIGCTPPDGGELGSEEMLFLNFSAPIPPSSLIRHLKILPDPDVKKSWNGPTLALSPAEHWPAGECIRIELDGSLRDGEGRILGESRSLSFRVARGESPPRVVNMGACGRSRTEGFPWIIPARPAPARDEALRLSFSCPMDREETERAFSLSPSLAGEVLWSGDDLVFLPEESFPAGRKMRVTLASSACSRDGIPLESEFIRELDPAVPYQSLECLACCSPGGFSLSEYSGATAADLPVTEPSPCDLLFRLTFSRPFPTDGEKQRVQQALRLREIFSSGGSPRAGFYSWESDRRLTVLYSGFPSDEESEYYYLLEIPGGEAGISNDEGSILEQDIRQLFRTARR